MRMSGILASLAAAVALCALGGAALAQAEGGAVEAARAAGTVGEQADGYLGFASPPSDALRQMVEQINIKRRAIYTDLAARRNATVQEVAAARGCDQLANKVKPGERYAVGGTWRTRGTTPPALPAVCG